MNCTRRRRLAASAVALLGAGLLACGGSGRSPTTSPADGSGGGSPTSGFRVETFLANLNFPVTMAFAPDGRLFFNELNTGQVRVVVNGRWIDICRIECS
ncbi:MAG: hypothetical protein ACE5HL_02380 [Terriglobia bacterium]